MKRALLIPVLMSLASPALCQGASLQDILSGKSSPVALHLRELTPDWSRVTVGTTGGNGLGDMMSQLGPLMAMGAAGGKGGGAEDAAGAAFLSSMLGGGGGNSGQQVYYTKGATTTIGSETFLVAYRYVKPEPNFMELMMQPQQAGKEPDLSKLAVSGKMTADSVLTLSLLNVKSISSLNDIRPFDMAREIAESEKTGGLWDILASQVMAKPVQQVKLIAPARPSGK